MKCARYARASEGSENAEADSPEANSARAETPHHRSPCVLQSYDRVSGQRGRWPEDEKYRALWAKTVLLRNVYH
jgi:hypothetical protein